MLVSMHPFYFYNEHGYNFDEHKTQQFVFILSNILKAYVYCCFLYINFTGIEFIIFLTTNLDCQHIFIWALRLLR